MRSGKAWTSSTVAARTALASAAAAASETCEKPAVAANETPPTSNNRVASMLQDANVTPFVPLPCLTSSHPLRKPYTFWYHARPAIIASSSGRSSKHAREAGYGLALRVVATVSTIEEFWCAYTRILRPNDMPSGSDMFLFEAGITPTWEDPRNAPGGRFIVRTGKDGTAWLWEEIVIALLRGSLSAEVRRSRSGLENNVGPVLGGNGGTPTELTSLDHGGDSLFDTVGAVVSIRSKEDALSLWVTESTQPNVITSTIRTHLDHILHHAAISSVDFKKHEGS